MKSNSEKENSFSINEHVVVDDSDEDIFSGVKEKIHELKKCSNDEPQTDKIIKKEVASSDENEVYSNGKDKKTVDENKKRKLSDEDEHQREEEMTPSKRKIIESKNGHYGVIGVRIRRESVESDHGIDGTESDQDIDGTGSLKEGKNVKKILFLVFVN